jgi:UDP-N-acetylglucosamine 2-epimerase (non-hydrolysing)
MGATMPEPLRILTVFGTRPEAIKLFPLVRALEADPRFVSRVCVSGQHRGMLDQLLTIAGLVPDHDLDLMRPDQSLDALTAALLTGLGRVMDAEKPDRVVVQGDTATAMAGALAAYYRKIPVCHVEAGLRSGNIHHPWPEEINRKIIGTIAALHCAPTETAAEALRRENVAPATIHVTGNTVIDALHWITARIAEKPELAAGLADLERRFSGKRIIGVTSHRRENFGEGMERIAAAIRKIRQHAGELAKA